MNYEFILEDFLLADYNECFVFFLQTYAISKFLLAHLITQRLLLRQLT